MQLPPRYVQLTARKGAHVRAHDLPLPQPETVVLANQDNFSIIGHGVFSIWSQRAADSLYTPRAKRADECQAGRRVLWW